MANEHVLLLANFARTSENGVMKKWCYLNGKRIVSDKASVHINDIGFLRGYGVFDYVKIYNGVPFLLGEHLARFKRSAAFMGLKLPHTISEMEKMCTELARGYKKPVAALRLILTGGTAHGLGFNKGSETCIIALEDVTPMDNELFERGATLMTYEHERLFPEVKSLNYITAVKLQKERIKRKAIEILFVWKGNILEASTSNFFLVKGDTVVTTKRGVLGGITRSHVLSLARRAGYTLEERDIALSELAEASEAFITASNKEVLPIVAIDRVKIGTGKVGSHTQKLMALYEKSLQSYIQKHAHTRS